MKKSLLTLTLLFNIAILFAQEDPLLIPYRKGNYWGYCTKDKKIVIDCVFTYATIFNNGFAIVKLKDSWNIIDKKGRYILPFEKEYSEIKKSGSSMFFVEYSQKYGMVDTSGKEIFPCSYDKPFDFFFGNFILCKDGKKGIADTTGKMILPCLYDVIWPSFSGRGPYVAKRDNKWMYMDLNGKTIITSYDAINPFSYGVAAVRMNGKWSLMDITGKLVAPFEYDGILPLSTHNYYTYKKNNQWGCIDANGKIIFPADFSGNLSFDSSGIGIAKNMDGYLLIDSLGRTLRKLECENARLSTGGLIEMCKNKNWGVCDISGKQIIPYSYQELTVYYNKDFVKAKRGNSYGAFNRKGEIVVPFRYDQLEYVSENAIKVKKNGLYGLLVNGKKQLGFRYKMITAYPEYNIADVFLDQRERGYIGFDGTKYWED